MGQGAAQTGPWGQAARLRGRRGVVAPLAPFDFAQDGLREPFGFAQDRPQGEREAAPVGAGRSKRRAYGRTVGRTTAALGVKRPGVR